jgi:hypothetical protein
VWLVDGPTAQIGGGTGWEKSLAGDGFEGLRRAISHRGDCGAVWQPEPGSGGEIPDGLQLAERRASIGLLDGAARATPYTYRGLPHIRMEERRKRNRED